jgi:O-antigen biosynthesis protein
VQAPKDIKIHDQPDTPSNASERSAGTSSQASDATVQRIAQLEALLADAIRHGRENVELRNRVTKLEVEISTLRASTSWRITAPLRQAARNTHAVKLGIQTLRRQADAQGGMAEAVQHYAAMFRREGFRGLKSRLERLRSGAGFADGPPSGKIYDDWIERFDTLGAEDRANIQTQIEALAHKPLISIVVPTYNSNPDFLREMIGSVCAQLYPHWELCIADDASPSADVRRILSEASEQDDRIKTVFRTSNGHISEASNSALELATGSFVALLDHDDTLAPHALFMAARYINLHPEARLFYSDEDKLTPEGKRTAPYFKSDWNPEMILAQNMFSHLGVFETALMREAGGFRKGFEGSQDHDLVLRCVEIAGNDKVVHIPHVLYHWRIAPGSTAASGNEKPYALLAAMRAIQEHLDRRGVQATVEEASNGSRMFRVRYALPSPEPRVSIIIPTRDGLKLLRQCIESIRERTLYANYDIIVVDNGSVESETLAYFDLIRQASNIRVIRDESPFNFSALNNKAAALAEGDYLCLLNNDIEVISRDWLNEMVSLAAQPCTGAVGARLWYPDDTLQHGGVIIGLGGIAGHMHRQLPRGHFGYFARAVVTQNLSAVTAACLVIRKSVYEEVGGLDEELAVAFNDVDFCLRVREAGYRNIWTPHAELYHHESASRGNDMDPDKFQRFTSEVRWMETRWAGHFERDPAYNPNLTLNAQIHPFSLAELPRIGRFE